MPVFSLVASLLTHYHFSQTSSVNGGLIRVRCKETRHEIRFSRSAIVRSEGPRCVRHPPGVEVRRLRKGAIGGRFPVYGERTTALPHMCRSRPFGLPAQRRYRSDPTCSEAQRTFRRGGSL